MNKLLLSFLLALLFVSSEIKAQIISVEYEGKDTVGEILYLKLKNEVEESDGLRLRDDSDQDYYILKLSCIDLHATVPDLPEDAQSACAVVFAMYVNSMPLYVASSVFTSGLLYTDTAVSKILDWFIDINSQLIDYRQKDSGE